MAFKTIKQVAEQLLVSQATVYSLCAQFKLPHVRVGTGRGTIRIDEADLAAFLQASKVEPNRLRNTAGLKHIRLAAGGSP
jgi:excisionase family DNA binding protein